MTLVRSFIVSFLVTLVVVSAQYVPFPGPVNSAAAVCTPPTVTSRWVVSDSNTVCTSGCSNGNQITSIKDLTASNNLTNSDSTTVTYSTSQINGLAAANFGSAPGHLGSTTSIFATNFPSAVSFYAVLKPVSAASIYEIFGSNSGGGAPEYRLTATNSFQQLVVSGTAVIATGNVGVSTSAYSTIAATYTVGGSVNFYSCSGGSCSSAGSATASNTFSDQTNRVGFTNGGVNFNGLMAEMGAYVGIINTTTLGLYSQCQYGI